MIQQTKAVVAFQQLCELLCVELVITKVPPIGKYALIQIIQAQCPKHQFSKYLSAGHPGAKVDHLSFFGFGLLASLLGVQHLGILKTAVWGLVLGSF